MAAELDNKRVAKNAIMLTMRMVLVTIVGLYTSRIVLQTLGVDDYGIYGVVGGVVGMAGFLNSAMSGATGRFITFEIGSGNNERLQRIFSTAMLLHIVIGIVIAIFAETIGLWFVNNKMNFPPGSMLKVNVLYQFSIASMVIGVTQCPYAAVVIAHEKMNIYAYLELANCLLKLVIVYILTLLKHDRLIVFASMMFAVSVLSALAYRLYCIRKFKESRFTFVWDKQLIKPMLVFSGLDLYGNMSTTVKFQSLPILLNMFFGVVANVGSSIASTVTGAISGLTLSITQAFQPQIIKQYSSGNIDVMYLVMRRSVQFTLLAYASLALPFFVKTSSILYIWLGQVPEYSVEFIRLIIITAFFSIIVTSSNSAIHATGDIRNISFYSGTLHLASPIISYFLLRFVIKDAMVVYITNIVLLIIIDIISFVFIKQQIPDFRIGKYARAVGKSLICIVATYVVLYKLDVLIEPNMQANGIWAQIAIIAVVGVIGLFLMFGSNMTMAFDDSERIYIKAYIKSKISAVRKHISRK